MRRFFWPLIMLAGTAILAGLMVCLLALTETGNRWLVEKIAGTAVNSLRIGEIKGSVFSGIHFRDVEVLIGEHQVQIQEGYVRGDVRGLFTKKSRLRHVCIKGFRYTGPGIQEIMEMRDGGHISRLPFAELFILDYGKFEEVAIYQGEKAFHLASVEVAGRADSKKIKVEKMKARLGGMFVSFKGDARFSPKLEFRGSLEWLGLLPNEEFTRGTCDFVGDFQHVALGISVSAPFVFDTQADLQIHQDWTRFSLIGDLVGQVSPYRSALVGGLTEVHHNSGMSGEEAGFTGLTSEAKQKDHEDSPCTGTVVCLSIKDVKARAFRGSVTLNGHVALEAPMSWKLTMACEDIDPSLKWPEWPGKLALQADVEGQMAEKNPLVKLENIELWGEIIGQPIRASGSLVLTDEGPYSDGFVVRSGANVVELSGGLYSQKGVEARGVFVDPDGLWPHLKGRYELEGSVLMAGNSPTGRALVRGRPVLYGHLAAENMELSLVFNSEDRMTFGGQMEMRNWRVADEALSDLRLTWDGNLQDHHVMGNMVSPSNNAFFEIAGNYEGSTWKATVRKASVESQERGAWYLSKGFDVSLSRTELKPFEACWLRNNEEACLNASWGNDAGWNVHQEFNGPPLDWLTRLVQEVAKLPLGKRKYVAP